MPAQDWFVWAVLSAVFGVTAYRAEHEGAPVIVPWRADQR